MKKIGLILLLLIGIIGMSKKQEEKVEKEELRGVYISYIEISKYLKEKDEVESKKNIDQMIENMKEYGLNTILLQVRPSLDAIYNSKTFPISIYLSEDGTYPYDVLAYFLEKGKENNIKVYAWLNPYRISTTLTKEELKEDSPAYKYKDTTVVYEKNGLYLNPARVETNEIILRGVKEVLDYKVDGILMDDYFYPDEEIDKEEYEEYKRENKSVTREEFHLEKVNKMVREVHNLCKSKNVPFGISPDGNLENNYEKNYADVKRWLQEEGYIDFIMPQLYYGFKNSAKPFLETSNEWASINKRKIPLYPVLAFYKTGKLDEYAKEGKEEWINGGDILQREIIHARNLDNYNGFILYRYDSLFSEELSNISKKEKESVKKLINTYRME